MSKNILIIMGSPRKNGSTAALCRQFAKGAEEAGHKVKTVNVIEDKINPCLGCNYCGSHNGQCCQPDAMRTIYQDFDKCDVIVLASPVYYYSITAQLKAFVDRLYAPGMGNGFKYDPKESVLIMTCGEAEKDVFDQPKMYYDFTQEKRKKHVFHYYLSHCKSSDMGIL